MTATDFLRLVSPMLILGLAAGCSGDDTDAPADTASPDSMAAPPIVQVRKPPPGLDIDRGTAVGQVVDEQGRLGWYPHEGSLTGNVFKWYEDWLDSSEAAQMERREAR